MKYLHEKITPVTSSAKCLPCSINKETARFLRGVWDKYRLVLFQNSPNITRDILMNFEISPAVFIPNTHRNRAIAKANRPELLEAWLPLTIG